MGHPFLKGLGLTFLLSLVYGWTFLTSGASPFVWNLLQWSFLPMILGVNICGVAFYMKRRYGNLDGLGRYAAGTATIVVLDVVLFVIFFLLLFLAIAASGGQ